MKTKKYVKGLSKLNITLDAMESDPSVYAESYFLPLREAAQELERYITLLHETIRINEENLESYYKSYQG